MPAYHETDTYAFHLMRVGASIIRKSDNTSVYFQPGDATQDALTAVCNCLTHPEPTATDAFDQWCGNFAELFESHGDFRRANDLKERG